MTCRDCAYWKQGELVDRGGTAVFKERKNKAPYLKHYCVKSKADERVEIEIREAG